MIVNPQVLKELKDVAGSEREGKAEEYVNKKRVNIKKVIYDNINNFEVRSKVRGNDDIYDVYMYIGSDGGDNNSSTICGKEGVRPACQITIA